MQFFYSCFRKGFKKHAAAKHKLELSRLNSPSIVLDSPLTSDSAEDEIITVRYAKDAPLEGSTFEVATAVDDSTKNWKFLKEGPVYTPVSADIGCCIKLEVTAVDSSEGNTGAVIVGPYQYFTDGVFSAPKAPPKRSFLTLNSNSSNSGGGNITSNSVRFRIITYNILAELYSTKSIYPHCDPWTLSWSYRKNLILQELYDLQGDIVCLQEIQADHYEYHLYPAMVKDGYEGLYKAKSRESMGQYGKVMHVG